jgi:hypothetical protein
MEYKKTSYFALVFFNFADLVTSKTSFPLKEPQKEHAWCAMIIFPHFSQATKDFGFKAVCPPLLLFPLLLLCRCFGANIFVCT